MVEVLIETTTVVEQYVAALEDEGVDYELGDEGNLIFVFADTVAGRAEGFIVVDEFVAAQVGDELEPLDLAFCEVFFVLPLEELLSGTDIGVLLEFLVRLNESHRIGAYELHIEERELRFRIYLTLDTQGPVAPDQLLLPLYEAVRAIDLHWQYFEMVLRDHYDPAHAIAEFYARESFDDEDGLNEELVSRAGELFDLARSRYRKAGHTELADTISTRLQELTRAAGEAVARSML